MSEFSDSRTLPLHDPRPLPTLSQLPNTKNHASLSKHNFTALRHPSALHAAPYSYTDWKDQSLLSQIYIPETEELVRRITGAHKVTTEALPLRSVGGAGGEDGWGWGCGGLEWDEREWNWWRGKGRKGRRDSRA